MLLVRPNLLCAVLIIMSAERVKLQALDMCRRINQGQLRTRILVGHVIATYTANFFTECAELCAGQSSCYSVNYYDKKQRCELNDKTSFNNPEHMMWVGDGSYVDIHRPYSDCSDLFCHPEQVCKMDRADHFYCRECSSAPLGMEDGGITDNQITASSVFQKYTPNNGRLNNAAGSWGAGNYNSLGEWLEIDFRQKMIITKVATQGKHYQGKGFVTSYKLSSSEDAGMWNVFKEDGKEKIFPGNVDQSTIVSHAVLPKIRQARYVRFHPMSWDTYIVMRVEVYGCKE